MEEYGDDSSDVYREGGHLYMALPFVQDSQYYIILSLNVKVV